LSQEKTRILNGETTKSLENKIYKNIEEALNMCEVKLEMKSRIEEGINKLMKTITILLDCFRKRRKTRLNKVSKNN